jgi:hypothetical protein
MIASPCALSIRLVEATYDGELAEPSGTSWPRPYPPTSLRQDPLFLSLSSSSRNLFTSSCSLSARSHSCRYLSRSCSSSASRSSLSSFSVRRARFKRFLRRPTSLCTVPNSSTSSRIISEDRFGNSSAEPSANGAGDTSSSTACFEICHRLLSGSCSPTISPVPSISKRRRWGISSTRAASISV